MLASIIERRTTIRNHSDWDDLGIKTGDLLLLFGGARDHAVLSTFQSFVGPNYQPTEPNNYRLEVYGGTEKKCLEVVNPTRLMASCLGERIEKFDSQRRIASVGLSGACNNVYIGREAIIEALKAEPTGFRNYAQVLEAPSNHWAQFWHGIRAS